MQVKESSNIQSLPTVPYVSDKRANIYNEMDNVHDNANKLKGFGKFKNSIVAGDNNFMNIVADYKETVENITSIIDDYLEQAESVMEEILKLIANDRAVKNAAEKLYDDYMSETSPHKKTITYPPRCVGGKWETITETIDTYAEDQAKAAEIRDEYWRANRSWVWED